MSQNYLITITGGTSPGPYTIYYNSINNNNIAQKYLYYTPATGVTLSELISGYSVIVPDNTNVIYLYNESCDIYQSFPAKDAPTEYDFCILLFGDAGIHFNPNGTYNGYETWISDGEDYSIIWDTTINKWKISGDSFNNLNYIIVSDSPYPPISGWYSIGGGPYEDIGYPSYSGSCEITLPLSFMFNINDPTCDCDGSIVITAKGGVPPYQYSIDNGVTSKNSPIFNNLCSGTYTLVVTDSNSQTTTQTVVLSNSQQPVTYTVNITTVSTILSTTPTSKTTLENVNISVTPALPPGVTLNMDISHINQFNSAPTPSTATLTTNTVLYKNGVSQGSPTQTVDFSSTTNTLPGCQGNLITIKDTTDDWTSITLTSTDTITMSTTTTVSWIPSQCLVADAIDTFYVRNLTINGCSCCNVIVT